MNIWCIYIYAMYESYKMLFAEKLKIIYLIIDP